MLKYGEAQKIVIAYAPLKEQKEMIQDNIEGLECIVVVLRNFIKLYEVSKGVINPIAMAAFILLFF